MNGKIIIGGSFTTYNGISKKMIARLNSDGTIDSFNEGFIGFKNNSSAINSLFLQNDGKIILIGIFNFYNYKENNNITRLNEDGTLDNTFNYTKTLGGVAIQNITIQNDGKIIICGGFNSYNEVEKYKIARIHKDGILDTTFKTNFIIEDFVFSSVIQKDGKLIVLSALTYDSLGITYYKNYKLNRLFSNGQIDSSFTPFYTGGASPYILQKDGKILTTIVTVGSDKGYKSKLIRLNTDGTLDNSFTSYSLGNYYSINSDISTITLTNDDKILIGGFFTYCCGVANTNIIRFNSDGSFDPSFKSIITNNNHIGSISVQNDNKIIVSGNYNQFYGSNRNAIKRLNNDGSLDSTFNSKFNSGIYQTILQEDGKIIIIGSFSSYNGIRRNYIAKINNDGSLDTNFDPGTGPSSNINSAAIQNDGDIIIGGSFVSYNSVGKNGLARIKNCINTKNTINIETCDNYVWFGNTYTSTGKYFHTLTNSTGCDSVITLNLIINNSTTTDIYLTKCESYNWFGNSYTTSGVYTHILSSKSGCDSTINLNLIIRSGTNTSSTQTVSVCDIYSWFGNSYTTSGIYTHTIPNSGGCDSLITLNLSVNKTSSVQNVSSCNSYTWFGNTYTTSGTYTQVLPNSVGCDSKITLNLTIKNSTTRTQTETACNTYTWYGKTYTTSGTYTQVLPNSVGCDSIITLNLTIKNSTTRTQTVTACNSYTWFGNTYTTSGTYTQVLPNSVGCDSTITLNLTIKNSTTATQTETACDTYTWFGNTYITSGTYAHILPNIAGCDSIITLNLTIKQSSASSQNATVCDTYMWFGNTYTTSGTYTHVLPNAVGCDSTITLNLTIKNSTTATQNVTTCNTYTWFGNTYTTSGTYTHVLPNAVGCDSTITLNLTIKNSTNAIQNTTACNNYTWFGNTYKTSGTHTHTLPNKAGCDSTIILNLTINPLDTTVAINHSVFTPNVSGATYQWLDCSNGNQLINGATTQSFTAADKTHEYAVIISKNGCSDTSSCLKISTLGMNSLDLFTGFSIYPNPTSNELFIVNQENTKSYFEILNAIGQVIYQGVVTDKTKVETSHFAPGVYVVKLENEKGVGYQKVVKE